MDNIIISENLTKEYNGTVAVNNLDLAINEGEIYGLLGPNGAGKSTIILMLLGLTEPTRGQIRVAGFNSTREPLKVKRITGYLPEKIGFYEDMSANDNLDYTAQLNNISQKAIPGKIEEALNTVGLLKDKNRMVKEFSKGMKQRLGIADVLIKDPKLVIFDEPTEGLDVKAANNMLGTITRLNKTKGITFLLSSHQLNLIQKICHRVGILSKGSLIGEGHIDSLGRDLFGGGRFRIELEVLEINQKLLENLKAIEEVNNIEKEGNKLYVLSDEDIRSEISKVVANSDSVLTSMNIKEYALEEIYLKYFKEE